MKFLRRVGNVASVVCNGQVYYLWVLSVDRCVRLSTIVPTLHDSRASHLPCHSNGYSLQAVSAFRSEICEIPHTNHNII